MSRDTLDAIEYFDRLASGQFAGFPALALVHAAARYLMPREQLRAAIMARRAEEARAPKF